MKSKQNSMTMAGFYGMTCLPVAFLLIKIWKKGKTSNLQTYKTTAKTNNTNPMLWFDVSNNIDLTSIDSQISHSTLIKTKTQIIVKPIISSNKRKPKNIQSLSVFSGHVTYTIIGNRCIKPLLCILFVCVCVCVSKYMSPVLVCDKVSQIKLMKRAKKKQTKKNKNHTSNTYHHGNY